MRISWLTTFLPSARATGSDIASQDLIDGLRDLGHTVSVHGYRSPGKAPLSEGEISVGDPVGEASTASRLRKMQWLFRSLITGEPLASVKYRSSRFSQLLPSVWKEADLVVVDHVQLAWLAPSGKPFVAIVHNVESRVYSERAAMAGSCFERLLCRREARLLARTEQMMAKRAQVMIALSGDDTEYCAGLGARAINAPLIGLVGTSTTAIMGPPSADIGLLGLWTWAPNRAGLDWFIREVLPLLPASITVAVAGRGTADLIGHPRLRVMGQVPDAIAFIRACRIHAVPSTAGGGIQVKTINAIALGVPLVATTKSLRGIDDVPSTVIVADSPADFARACMLQCEEAQPQPELGARWQAARRVALRTALGKIPQMPMINSGNS